MLSLTWRDKLGEALFRANQALPTSLWVALYVAAPGPDGGGTECDTTLGYGRLEVPVDTATWDAFADGESLNTSDFDFGEPDDEWGPIVAAALHTHPTDDALFTQATIISPALAAPPGAPFVLPAGSVLLRVS